MKSWKHHKKYDVFLNEDQNSKLQQLVSSIADVGKETLENVLAEADANKGKGEVLRKVWKMDVDERVKYYKDQKAKFFVIYIYFTVQIEIEVTVGVPSLLEWVSH